MLGLDSSQQEGELVSSFGNSDIMNALSKYDNFAGSDATINVNELSSLINNDLSFAEADSKVLESVTLDLSDR